MVSVSMAVDLGGIKMRNPLNTASGTYGNGWQFEGFYDESRQAFDALSDCLKHDLGKELDRHRTTIQQMLEQEIISAVYYQRGALQSALQYDKQLLQAEQLLKSPAEYRKILSPGE